MPKKSLKILIIAGTLGMATALSPSFAAPSFDSVKTISSDASLNTYQKIYIAPVEVDLERQTGALARLRAKSHTVSDSEANEKAEDLYQVLANKLSNQAELVDQPGPGVLTIRPTLTRLAPSRLNTVEGARNINRDPVRTVSAGGAKIELTLSAEDVTLMKIKDRIQSTFVDGAPRVSRWQDADSAFINFSNKLERFLQKN